MKLNYKDEKDKCYGATGMAMGIVIFDGEDMLSAVNLDADPAGIIEFVESFYFSGNPRVSAKTSWNRILNSYNISMGVSMANILCRSLVMEGMAVDEETLGHLREIMIEEGRAACSLDDDEINSLFDKNYGYLRRVFSHSGVQSVAREFAETLTRMRRMSRAEVVDNLRALNML